MKGKKLQVIILGLFILCICGCNTKREGTIINELEDVNVEGIRKAFDQSCIDENGYRFATAEYEGTPSSYATYYITQAKENFGSSTAKTDDADTIKLLDKLLEVQNPNLTDIYCAILLVHNPEKIDSEIGLRLRSYLESLYVNEYGCYGFANVKLENKAEYVYPTYLVVAICEKNGCEYNDIDSWLIDTWNSETSNNIDLNNSNAYQMLAELMLKRKMEIEPQSMERLISVYQEEIKELSEGKESKYYLPVLLMNYEALSQMSEAKNTLSEEDVINLMVDSNKHLKKIVTEYDAFGLYAAMRALNLSSHGKANELIEYEDTFGAYDVFQLTNNYYIQPGNTEANIIDTYYVNKISETCDIDTKDAIAKYCGSKLSDVEEMNVAEIFYLLSMMEDCGLIEKIPEATMSDLLTVSKETLGNMLENGMAQDRIPAANYLLSIINIIDGEYIVKDYTPTNIEGDDLSSLYYRAEQIILVARLTKNEKLSLKYCKEMETDMLAILNDSEVSRKLLLLDKCYEAFSESGYDPSEEFVNKTVEIINDSKCADGLYKGGDCNEDIESFENSYYGVKLINMIKERYKND